MGALAEVALEIQKWADEVARRKAGGRTTKYAALKFTNPRYGEVNDNREKGETQSEEGERSNDPKNGGM